MFKCNSKLAKDTKLICSPCVLQSDLRLLCKPSEQQDVHVTEGCAEEYILSPNSNLASAPTSLAFALEFAEQEQYIIIIY